MEELSRRANDMEREKKKNNVVIRVWATGMGENGVSKLWLVELGNQEEKKEVMRMKKKFKGNLISMDEDRMIVNDSRNCKEEKWKCLKKKEGVKKLCVEWWVCMSE